MSRVEVIFEAELPFWLGMNDGEYKISIDEKLFDANGNPWIIKLSNDKWYIAMGNELDKQSPMIAIANTANAKKSKARFPEAPYHHKRKLRTVIEMGFGWEIKDGAKPDDAKTHLEKHWKWCTDTFLKSTNRFIDIYRTSNTMDKMPLPVAIYDLSFNWWYTLFLDGNFVDRVRLDLDAYPIIPNPPIEVDKEVQDEITSKLASTISPPSWRLIFENGRGFHRRGNYRMAVIEVYSGFESFLIDFVRKKFEEKGYEEKLINHLTHLNYANFMLKQGLDLSIGKTFESIDPVLWNEWSKKDGVQALRRKIVHRNRTTVLKEESENAINVINKMIKKIINEG